MCQPLLLQDHVLIPTSLYALSLVATPPFLAFIFPALFQVDFDTPKESAPVEVNEVLLMNSPVMKTLAYFCVFPCCLFCLSLLLFSFPFSFLYDSRDNSAFFKLRLVDPNSALKLTLRTIQGDPILFVSTKSTQVLMMIQLFVFLAVETALVFRVISPRPLHACGSVWVPRRLLFLQALFLPLHLLSPCPHPLLLLEALVPPRKVFSLTRAIPTFLLRGTTLL